MGPRGLLYCQGTIGDRLLPALDVPEDRILDTNGAGDIAHGAYVYSVLTNPDHTWDEISDLPAPHRRMRSST